MLTVRHVLKCHRTRFMAIDLKDTYFQSFLGTDRFFGLPFSISVQGPPFWAILVITKIVEAALTPLREVGICKLNYLDDWLIITQSQDLVCKHRDLVLEQMASLGLWVN